MKKYMEVEMNIVMLEAQDVITMSGFAGFEDGFGNPNEPTQETGDVGNF